MESATRSARNILTGLHEVMASKNHAQGKLNHVVNIIGEALSSEVCSIYLLRDGALELFATRGLNQAAVHITRLGLGEGLVGTIAEKSARSSTPTTSVCNKTALAKTFNPAM
jgi:phosphotransferase system enzyme I (PtsP)